MKQILINDNQAIQSNLIDFINDNIDGLTFQEINNLNKLKVNDSIYISTHCDSVEIIRTK
tara:strand:- start:289 stop:468 length:180 start_codon:yes stop_codon:yes gene_type:complete